MEAIRYLYYWTPENMEIRQRLNTATVYVIMSSVNHTQGAHVATIQSFIDVSF